jgi:hypothetical protein
VDIKPLDHCYQRFEDIENLSLDLNEKQNCEVAARGAQEIYNLAANMGGMGFIEKNKAVGTDQHPHAPSSREIWSDSIFLFVVGLCLQRRQTKEF